MTCLEASLQGQLYIHGTPIRAELIEQDTEKPEANTGESALRTSDTTDKPTKTPNSGTSEDQTKPSGPQYTVLLSNIHPSLRHYTPYGPEYDLRWMLEDEYGPVLSVQMKRSSTPAGECLLGTAEVTFAKQKTLERCIEASTERYLFLFGRLLHAKAV